MYRVFWAEDKVSLIFSRAGHLLLLTPALITSASTESWDFIQPNFSDTQDLHPSARQTKPLFYTLWEYLISASHQVLVPARVLDLQVLNFADIQSRRSKATAIQTLSHSPWKQQFNWGLQVAILTAIQAFLWIIHCPVKYVTSQFNLMSQWRNQMKETPYIYCNLIWNALLFYFVL